MDLTLCLQPFKKNCCLEGYKGCITGAMGCLLVDRERCETLVVSEPGQLAHVFINVEHEQISKREGYLQTWKKYSGHMTRICIKSLFALYLFCSFSKKKIKKISKWIIGVYSIFGMFFFSSQLKLSLRYFDQWRIFRYCSSSSPYLMKRNSNSNKHGNDQQTAFANILM